MSSVAPPPNPCLVAIVLVVESRAGPRFVYHYPPNPLSDSSLQDRGSYYDDSSNSSDDDSSSSSDDDATTIGASSLRHHVTDGDFAASPQGRKARNPDEDEDDTSSPEGEESYRAPWETVLGFSTDALQKLLCPTRAWHKRRFEFGINDLAFIGWPVFVREDGMWQKKQMKRRAKKKKELNEDDADEENGSSKSQRNGNDMDEGLGGSEEENVAFGADAEVRGLTEGQNSPLSEPNGITTKEAMTMFNVVFVLNPPALEYPFRIREMYENVVKKLSRALKWEQGRANYVWKQSQAILSLKERAREERTHLSALDSEIRRDSSLARAFADIFKYISASQIASIKFSSDDSISLQIPPISSISILPSATQTPLPGVWLTTADSVSSPAEDPSVTMNQAASGSTATLAKHFALLLLDSEASILKSLGASAVELATAMAHYVQRSTPTKSFAQISTLYNIPLNEIQVLASHLVYWRRARAIPPLHQRDTYIVSPNADLKTLTSAAIAYSAAFPALPSLPRMLSLLSGPPRNFGSLIPSKDHKEVYFAILAWLLRGGWVTQLRTFAWIRVSSDVKRAVAEQMAAEDVERQKDASALAEVASNADSTSPTTTSLPSPPISRGTTETNGDSNRRTSSIHYIRPAHTHSSNHFKPSTSTASLLTSPHRATPLESRWLDHLASSFPQPSPSLQQELPDTMQDLNLEEPDSTLATTATTDATPYPHFASHAEDDIAALWPLFIKYLNGHDALDKIAVREGMKRKRVWDVLLRLGVLDGPKSVAGRQGNKMEKNELVVSADRWDTGRENGDRDGEKDGLGGVSVGRRVVGVRHW